MPYSSLTDFIGDLEKRGELHRIKAFADPVLEITEVTDRVTKSGGKALLFENNGTSFPLLINAFGSAKRMALALGKDDLAGTAKEIQDLIDILMQRPATLSGKLSALPRIAGIASRMPARIKGKGLCQKVIHHEPDLGILPVLKCWPHDGGRFITLPVVHTVHPETGKPNAGMYRMQIFDRNTTGMHWQRHKTGANHFEAWKKSGRRMPVTVTLGGDPVYTYCATAPLPENIDEYLLAGILRKKRVSLTKSLTNDIYIPSDADIVIEGYVDPAEELVTEGPFGDHTGFYSLADKYPAFHVTCITHAVKAVYPATIVGVPPQEDAWFALATETIFLAPLRMAIQPEIADFHMPGPGVAHNLLVVRINKTYPGQGMKVINSLSGAGQMMFTKYLVVVSGETDIRNYRELCRNIFSNTRPETDITFVRGPLDVLDHSSDTFSYGGKAGIDATVKLPEEILSRELNTFDSTGKSTVSFSDWFEEPFIKGFNASLYNEGIPVLIITVDPSEDPDCIGKSHRLLSERDCDAVLRLVIAVDHTVDPGDFYTVAWQVLGNSDPIRDHYVISPHALLIDGTIKFYKKGGFPRKWPNVVCSSSRTIEDVDARWELLDLGRFIPSPSLKYSRLVREGDDKVG